MGSTANRRDRVLALTGSGVPDRTPAAFFLHFEPACHRGQAAIGKHIEFFRATDMDLVKIQYEHPFPARPELRKPEDWARIPRYGREFFQAPLEVVSGLVKEMRREAVVVVTLYSAFMFAGQMAGSETLARHLEEDPVRVAAGLEIVTESMLAFVRGCIDAGVDGFYASTQGGEADRFKTPGVFERYIKPSDIAVWQVLRACPFNILHVCDYNGVYETLAPYRDYPGHVVSTGLRLKGGPATSRAVSELFGRPFLGGMDRHGVIGTGTATQVRAEATTALESAPARFMLGADCTVPSTAPWANLRAAVDTAHGWRR